jgi:putative nucleotidyltransferase with HDIG domain
MNRFRRLNYLKLLLILSLSGAITALVTVNRSVLAELRPAGEALLSPPLETAAGLGRIAEIPRLAGTFLIVLLVLALMYRLIQLRTDKKETRNSRLLLMSLLLLLPLLAAQALVALLPLLRAVYGLIPSAAYGYLVPSALTALLAGILLGFEVAVYLAFASSLFVALLMGGGLSYFLYALLGSLAAAIPMARYDTRHALWQHGLRVGVMNCGVLGMLMLLAQREPSWLMGADLGAGLLNGLAVALIASTFLPALERLFDITTSLRLLELSNLNHPALKELAVRAPGTYHHSVVVGNLSEGAAEGIRANPLLVRVASYYHDLGKMLCPLYFVENQHQKNFHDDLPAQTSARIIVNHVRDGLEIARRHRLGRAITDIIAQHHGDSLVRYFYHKAQEEHGGAEAGLSEEEFRYAGPKPQTKEAGVVMCADVTEAAIRSLDDPAPEEIRAMVQKLMTRIYMEGQLDESGMTFNDLSYIEKTFTRMLVSIHHHRITYPDLRTDGKRQERLEDATEPPQPPRRPDVGGR